MTEDVRLYTVRLHLLLAGDPGRQCSAPSCDKCYPSECCASASVIFYITLITLYLYIRLDPKLTAILNTIHKLELFQSIDTIPDKRYLSTLTACTASFLNYTVLN